METTTNYFLRDMGVLLGRTIRHMHRSMHAVTLTTLVPLSAILLFLYVFGGVLLALEEILLAITCQPDHR